MKDDKPVPHIPDPDADARVAMNQEMEQGELQTTPVPTPDDDATNATAIEGEDAEREIHRLARRSFLWSGVAVAAAFGGLRWLTSRRPDSGIPWPMRRALEVNEQLARDYFKPSRLSPTFSRSVAKEPRVNGILGLTDFFDPSTWKLRVVGLASIPEDAKTDPDVNEPTLLLNLDDIKSLPHVEMVTELRCIEGWSDIAHWGGARFSDFTNRYRPATRSGNPPDIRRPEDLVEYVSLETPDGQYYVGLDMRAVLHPQTLLCYELNGKPLALEHGAPLRLVIPVMYGVKNIKRIQTIRFTNERPADYWAERGYDWYTGH